MLSLATKKELYKDKVIELRKQGLTYKDIAKRFKISAMTVRDIILENAPELAEKNELTLKLELSPGDYQVFKNIKKELEKSLDNVSDEYVFIRLLWAWDELKKLKERLQALREGSV